MFMGRNNTRQNKKRIGARNQFFIKIVKISKISMIPFQKYAIRPHIGYTFKQGAKTVLQKLAISQVGVKCYVTLKLLRFSFSLGD